MISKSNDKREIINQIKLLTREKGFIYSLCMIISEDLSINLEKIDEIDNYSKLNVNEITLLLGFWIQNDAKFLKPDSPKDLFDLKEKICDQMDKLHSIINEVIHEKICDNFSKKDQFKTIEESQKDLFGKGDVLVELIFYAGTGVYDFQLMEFLEEKYKYDKKWLYKNKKIKLEELKNLTFKIKDFIQIKNKNSIFRDLALKNLLIFDLNNKYKCDAKRIRSILNSYKYTDLVLPDNKIVEFKAEKLVIDQELALSHFDSILDDLTDYLIFEKKDLEEEVGLNSLLTNFSFEIKKGCNSQLQTIGDYNVLNSKPIIKLDKGKYFIPLPFLLFKSVYENPFYWMLEDKEYKNTSTKNRGKVSEELVYNLLLRVFGKEHTHKSVKITSKKGQDDTDIDILCILGNKALCVQVKSKKLTQLSRKGDDNQLKKDFKAAIQYAYKQGLVSREKVIENKAKFFDENGKEIILSEEINEAYIMGVTTEEFPSLTPQSHLLLDKNENDPYPIFLTIFDLDLLCHYLNDSYDFLYYIRQRTSLMDCFEADEEIVFLGYHLINKLSKNKDYNKTVLTSDFGQLISQNYLPFKLGIDVKNDDSIKNKWSDENFDAVCNELKSLNFPQKTDILFYLLDFSGKYRKEISNFILGTKEKTLQDNKKHDFTVVMDDNCVGFTYWSVNYNNLNRLKDDLLNYCSLRKYKFKTDNWIGFGSIKNSNNLIDVVLFNETPWKYDEKLEKLSNIFVKNKKSIKDFYGKKIGRNDPCPCGSGKKYKKCCLLKY